MNTHLGLSVFRDPLKTRQDFAVVNKMFVDIDSAADIK
jgi:hypothetical protein